MWWSKSDSDEAESELRWQWGRKWLREWATIWVELRWWRGREAETRDVIERVRERQRAQRVIERVRRGFHHFRVKFCSMRMLQTTLCRKKKRKRWNDAVLRLETRQLFEPVMVHRTIRLDCGPYRSMLFLHGTVLHLKQIVEVDGSRVSRSDRTVQSGFKNLAF